MLSIKSINNRTLPLLYDVYSKTIRDDFPEYGKKTLAYFTSHTYWKSMASLQIKLGVFLDGKLIGFCLSERPIGGLLNIEWFSIVKEYRGQRIGSALLSHIEKMALKFGIHNIRLECDRKNLKFYEKNGFEILGFDKNCYFGADNYIMKKMIAKPSEKNFLNPHNT